MSEQAVKLAVPAEKVKCRFEPDTSSWCRLSNGHGNAAISAAGGGKAAVLHQKSCLISVSLLLFLS
jgi:hypothetical protein